jgi:CubicO group peptidase (beta-lactamase class C family)
MKKKRFWIIGIIVIVLIVSLVVGVSYTGSNTSQFTGPVSADEPLPDNLISDLEKYVLRLMKQFDVPGVAIVLVQGDRVIYARGLGVSDLATQKPVTTQTLFGIGSSTKPMTAIMVASLVDEGVINWDTPVTDILPSFAVSDPEITKRITVKHTLCMCTGVPRKIEDISVQYSELTAEDVIESLRTIPLEGAFEQHYAYSERMFSAGGYLAAMAAGGEYGDLAQAYIREMQARVLDPVGMTSSTLSIDEAVSSGDYATPYYSSITDYEAIPPEIEGVFTPIAPTGAMWSNADDLGKFLIMLLKNGVSADGQRVVSEENLAHLWKPRTTIDETFKYGLGWNVENYHGLTIVDHPGGTVGFASELVVIPDLDIGFAMLINRLDLVHQMGRMTRYRLLEMLTGSEQVYDQEARKEARKLERQIPLLLLITRKTVNPDKITPFLGSYHNDVLGDVRLVLHEDHTLWVDFSEYESAIRRLIIQKDQYIFFESVFMGKTIQLKINPDGTPTMSWSGNEGTYNFVATNTQE